MKFVKSFLRFLGLMPKPQLKILPPVDEHPHCRCSIKSFKIKDVESDPDTINGLVRLHDVLNQGGFPSKHPTSLEVALEEENAQLRADLARSRHRHNKATIQCDIFKHEKEELEARVVDFQHEVRRRGSYFRNKITKLKKRNKALATDLAIADAMASRRLDLFR
ncbi:hypothetical protein UFOVP75_148 [uncultured Caudovirales phage]|uniref:Uncharacterized protein n=1 Tax=uncultured Caudovirales phage TaxID=2100421 RepID=A0A6J5KZ51_9CAUD|nr:hypothetical protein UFOVP75_148 [uncultured Caudovirales phage]